MTPETSVGASPQNVMLAGCPLMVTATGKSGCGVSGGVGEAVVTLPSLRLVPFAPRQSRKEPRSCPFWRAAGRIIAVVLVQGCRRPASPRDHATSRRAAGDFRTDPCCSFRMSAARQERAHRKVPTAAPDRPTAPQIRGVDKPGALQSKAYYETVITITEPIGNSEMREERSRLRD